MDYSQLLYLREELSLIAVLLILFVADLFMSPDAHKKDGQSRLNTLLPVILLTLHTLLNLVPGQPAEAFGGMY
nr:NADH-quinone oxidoreductase subunit N [Bacteroides sp.]